MISENFTTKYGDEIIVRHTDGHAHVQVLITYADGSDPTTYGFTFADFEIFRNIVCQVANRVGQSVKTD